MAINIIPLNDSEEHEELSTCKCKPRVDLIHGSMTIIHNSFDGREAVEEAKSLLNMKGLSDGPADC